jgi:two-component system alkaline phosphatase synthesis response regulator PhoP
MTKILIITEDSSLEKQVNVTLKYHGFTVHTVDSTTPAWKLLSEIRFDIVMIDFQLKHESGLAFYKALRMYGSKTPLLMIGDGFLDEFILKDLSIDHYDYIMKPFFFQDLKQKINGLMSSEEVAGEFVNFGAIKIDVKHQLVLVKDQILRLGKTELNILILLAKKAGQVVDLKKIVDILEKEDQRSVLTAQFYVKKLCKKMAGISQNAIEIINIKNQGFKLEYLL